MTVIFNSCFLFCSTKSTSDNDIQSNSRIKALNNAIAVSQKWTELSFAIIAGAIIIIISSSFHRPRRSAIRHTFWLFIPG